MTTRTLVDAKSGEEVTIKGLYPEVSVELRRHLLGMGLVKGSKIRMEKIAPLGDPIKFKIKGYSGCLRKDEARYIEIE